MKITIIGATGYLGKALIEHLLSTTRHSITGFSKSAEKLTYPKGRFNAVNGNVLDSDSLQAVLANCDCAIYLVHMMGAKHDDYAKLEAEAATQFAAAAKKQHVGRVIYVGGLGDDSTELSKHLSSRQRSGLIMREQLDNVIELRASMIIGNGSVGYDIIKAIAQKLPVTAVPRWANTPTQPIALADMLRYITACLAVKVSGSQVVEVGGPEVLTYPQMLSRYTAWNGKRHHVFMVPFVPRFAARWWLNRYLPRKDAGIGGPMIDSLHNPMIVTTTTARDLFPAIQPSRIESAF